MGRDDIGYNKILLKLNRPTLIVCERIVSREITEDAEPGC